MTREEKADLVSRYLEDSLDAEEIRNFEALLEADPEARELLRELVLQDALLRRLGQLAEAPGVPEAGADTPAPSGPLPRAIPRRPLPARRPRGPAGSGGRRLGWAWAAAGILVALGTAGYLLSPSTDRAPAPVCVLPAAPVVRGNPERTPVPPAPPPPLPRAPESPEAPLRPPAPASPPAPKPPPVPAPPGPRVPPAIAPAPLPAPPPAAPAPAAAPPDTERPGARTVALVAALERWQGPVFIRDEAGAEKAAEKPGTGIASGHGVRTGERGFALVQWSDGTRLQLGTGTLIQVLGEEGSKRLVIGQGSVRAEVAKQPKDRPMLFISPGGETKILGTTLRVTVEAGAKPSTHVEVTEGRVELKRSADGRTVEIPAGQAATAAAGTELAARPVRPLPGLVALYLFDEGRGALVHDHVAPALSLRARDESALRWLPGALGVGGSALLESTGAATKITEGCRRTNELSVEAWIRPATAKPPQWPAPGRIVSLSKDLYLRNFTLEQGSPDGTVADRFNFRLRTPATKENGYPPAFESPVGSVQPELMHVVYTRDAGGNAILYLDGRPSVRTSLPGAFSTWDDGYRLLLGDEGVGQRSWAGEYYYLAIYSRAIPGIEIERRYQLGPK